MVVSDESDEGPKHPVQRTSTYPMSRLAPVHDLVDVARQIEEADHMLGTTVNAKLQEIAIQIRTLQSRAKDILESARGHAALHRAQCNFRKRPGQTYHLYRRANGDPYLSLLSPDEWGEPPHEHEGAYRLEADMSWTPADEPRNNEGETLRALIEGDAG